MNRDKELKRAIIEWLFENENEWQRVNSCRDAFRPYIYDSTGDYLLGGEAVSEFISLADKVIYGKVNVVA